MKRVIFNSKSELHKKPFGAISTNEYVSFSIHISKDECAVGASFVYRHDAQATPIYIDMHKTDKYEGYDIYNCEVNFKTADLYFYRFEIKTENGIKFVGLKNGEAYIEDWLPEWQLTVYDADFTTPDWVKGGIMYQIFPDRFCRSANFQPLPSANTRKIHENWYDIPEFIYDNPDYKANDYFCGNIDGIIEKLDYIKSLGVNVIYLNPIFESPEYHRYSTADYMKLDPYFGTNEKFKEFTECCKVKGIKVILDGVFSHTGADSVYFNKYNNYHSVGAYNSDESKYRNWYNFTEYPEKYECWWGFDNLPNVNETHPDYMDYITGENGVLKYWQNLGCCGWRLDVADELPDEFLDALYKRVKSTDSSAFVVGEVWEDATNKFAYGIRRRYLLGGQMDSVMNYPWRTAILDFVRNRDEKLFNDRLFSIMENYPPHVLQCLMNSISTHDTIRAITYFGVEHDVPDNEKGNYKMTVEEYNKGKSLLLCATFLQFTLPGIPSIYYGDEVGLQGFRDPYCRMGFPYGNEDFEILDFYKELGNVRVEYRDDFSKNLILHDMENGFYSFYRGNLLCAINVSNTDRTMFAKDKKIAFCRGCVDVNQNSFTLKQNSMLILK